MAQLHQLLAVEGDMRGQAEACRKDLINTFEKKQQHFSERLVTFKAVAEGVADKTENQLALQTTVTKELTWISGKLTKAIDIGYTIDVANTTAQADIVLEDGTFILRGVPAPALMRMQHRVEEVKALVVAIPTLDPSKGFTEDAARGAGIYKAREANTTRTEKAHKFQVLVPATDKHPAQVHQYTADEPVGTVTTQEWSSLITVSDKGDMLDRVEILIRSIKAALSRANSTDVGGSTPQISATLLDFVFSGKRP